MQGRGIKEENGLFVLNTDHTTYAFAKLPSGHLEHLYYGEFLDIGRGEYEAMRHKAVNAMGCGLSYSEEEFGGVKGKNVYLEEYCLEASGEGKGDFRQPFIKLTLSNGCRTTDFRYESYRVEDGAPRLETLPFAYVEAERPGACANPGDGAKAGVEDGARPGACVEPGRPDAPGSAGVQTLYVCLKERHENIRLELYYTVYPEADCIVRGAILTNRSGARVCIDRLMSTQLDLERGGYRFVTFGGHWASEMNHAETLVQKGCASISSRTGNSSNVANPFVMLAHPEATETFGECFACNLIYSGNHKELVEVDGHGKSRFLAGINEEEFAWMLESGEFFETPQAVMTVSAHGFSDISRHMHHFVREHVVRGEWKHKERPVLLNSWEAAYFHFDEHKLLSLAKAGAQAGIELFVVDDGWFGRRNNDTCSLGDWKVNPKKLPHGFAGLAEKLKAMNMRLGVWVEPEMVNVDSDLYRAHPDYAVQVTGRAHSEGRNQRILDFTRKDVRDEIIAQLTEVFSSADIQYVKWDMNRNFSDVYSSQLPPQRQKEFSHRYVMGLYEVMKTLTERFPHILFEGCASGGNRFDLGILCYMPQIWGSDNTDALCRARIQNGYSYGYPQSVIGAHVSGCPNHQTLRETPLDTRFCVAAFGVLGYECNLAAMSKQEREEIAAQVALYKKWRKTLQYGDWYRLDSSAARNCLGMENVLAVLGASAQDGPRPGQQACKWLCVAPDKSGAVGVMVQGMVSPNHAYEEFRARGLAPEKTYRFTNQERKVSIRRFGDLVNLISPVAVKKDGLAMQVADKFIKMDGERECVEVSGACLNQVGVKLSQGFAGGGYEKNTRLYQDFDARMYFMEEVVLHFGKE